MLSIQQCETILNKNRKQKLTKEQVAEVKTFLMLLAKISIQEYKKSSV
jgi:hypothetical protein